MGVTLVDVGGAIHGDHQRKSTLSHGKCDWTDERCDFLSAPVVIPYDWCDPIAQPSLHRRPLGFSLFFDLFSLFILL